MPFQVLLGSIIQKPLWQNLKEQNKIFSLMFFLFTLSLLKYDKRPITVHNEVVLSCCCNLQLLYMLFTLINVSNIKIVTQHADSQNS